MVQKRDRDAETNRKESESSIALGFFCSGGAKREGGPLYLSENPSYRFLMSKVPFLYRLERLGLVGLGSRASPLLIRLGLIGVIAKPNFLSIVF